MVGTLSSGRGAGAATAASFPARPVTLIVPWAPGGTTDFLARTLQPYLERNLGQKLVIENRPGAAGNIAATVAARAPADGHTMFFGDLGTTAINPVLYKDLKVDYERDFAPLSVVARMPVVLVVHPGFPADSVGALVAHLRSRPGDVSYVSQGSGTVNHLVMEAFAARTGVKVVHVPNKGGTGPSSMDIIGGHVPIGFASLSGVSAHIREGRMRALAITSEARHAALPDVPALAELGHPDLVFFTWQALSVPARTPAAETGKLRDAIASAMSEPEVIRKIREAGAEPAPSATPEDAWAFTRSEIRRWAKIAHEVGVTVD